MSWNGISGSLGVIHEMQAHHHHARDPEEDDVEAGDQRGGRIIALEFFGFVRPAERRERPQRGGEPGVEHVLVAPERISLPSSYGSLISSSIFCR